MKILRFALENFDKASIGGGTTFLWNEKNFEVGQKIFFYFFINSLCEPILVFLKLDPLTAPGMC